MTGHTLTQQNVILRDGERLFVLVRLSTEAPPDTERVPLDLGIALDRSSSMRGKPLRGALAAARAIAERLDERDRLTVVVYDRDVHTLWGPAPVASQGRLQLLDRLDHVMSGYLTNLGGAYIETCRHVASQMGEGRVARVILLTDGYPSYGICDAQELAEMSAFQHARGIVTTSVGFGNAFDEDLLTRMARSGGGNFYFVSTPDDIPRAFAQELGHVFYLGAQEVRARVKMSSRVESLGVLHDYPASKTENHVEIQIGEFYHGMPRNLLLEFHSSHLNAGGEVSLGEIEFFYKKPNANQQEVSFSFPVLAPPVTPGASRGPVDLHPTVGRELLLLASAKAQAEAIHLADNGASLDARRLLEGAGKRLKRFCDAYPEDAEMKEHANDLDSLARRISAGALDAIARKQVIHRTHHTRLSQLGLHPARDRKPNDEEEQ